MTIWQAVTASIVAGLIVALLSGSAKFLAPRARDRWSNWWQRRDAARQAHRADRDREQRERLRQDRIAAAHAEGRIIPVSRRGHHPVEVTFSDDTRSYYFDGDMMAYTTAMRSGHYPLTRTFHTAPPPIE